MTSPLNDLLCPTYLALNVCSRSMFDRISGFFIGGIARRLEALSPASGAIVGALGVLVVEWLFLLYLYRRRIFLKV